MEPPGTVPDKQFINVSYCLGWTGIVITIIIMVFYFVILYSKMFQDAYSLKIGVELALFTITRTWKQCPLADEWIRSCDTYTQWTITQL